MSKIEEILNEFGGVVYYEQLPDRHKKAIAQLRALVDEVIRDGEERDLDIFGYPSGVEGQVKLRQRQRADDLFGVQQPYTSGHGGYDENFVADAELDHKGEMGEDNDN